jgi:DNA ligase (NAD+)
MRFNIKRRFRGEVICFTGKSKYTRVQMHKLAIKNGATITSNITNKTSLLIMGERPGSKLDRAFAKGIEIMMDDEFLRDIE